MKHEAPSKCCGRLKKTASQIPGARLYQFTNTKQDYHHYLAKATAKAQPKVVFDLIRDPLSVFIYDKATKEIEIIDKLDDKTYVARLLRSWKAFSTIQCVGVFVITHQCIIPNEKYAIAMISVEHYGYPTIDGNTVRI